MSKYLFHAHMFEVPDEPLYAEHFGDEQEITAECWWPEKGDVVIDVGAGAGRYSIPALAMGATVLAFEPRADWLEALKRCAELNGFSDRLVPLDVALFDGSEPTGLMDMIEASQSADLSPRNAGFSTLDAIVGELRLKSIDWIKVDVEGQEIGVLQGGYRSICQHLPRLLIEDHSRVYPELGHAHHLELMAWLDRMDYEVETRPYERGVPRDFLVCKRPWKGRDAWQIAAKPS